MSIFFSAFSKAFYSSRWRGKYEQAGNWPSDAVEITDACHRKYINLPPDGWQLGANELGQPVWVRTDPPGLEMLVVLKHRDITVAHADRRAEGMVATFGAVEDIVQTRAGDILNLVTLAARAQQRFAAGDITPFPFRAQSNTVYQVSPADMLNLAREALEHVEAIEQQTWQARDQLTAAHTVGDRSAVAAITPEWP